MADINNDPSALYDEEFMKKREKMFGKNAAETDVSSGRTDNLFEEEEAEQKSESTGFFARFRRNKNKNDDDSGYDIFDLEKFETENEVKEENNPDAEKKQVNKAAEKKAKKPEKRKMKKQEDYISASDKASVKSAKDESLNKTDINALKKEKNNIQPTDEVKRISVDKKAVEDKIISEANISKENEDIDKIDDINALLESVGISPVDLSQSPKKAENTDEATKVIKIAQENVPDEKEDITRTRHFNVSAVSQKNEKDNSDDNVADAASENGQIILDGYKDEEAPVKVNETVVEERLKSTRKRLIDNFRVLANNADDRTILEKEDENAKQKSVAETIKPKDGEDIFEAVERAEKKKSSAFLKLGEIANVKALQLKAKKDKEKKQYMSASAVNKQLKKQCSKKLKQIKLQIALTVVLVILSILSSAYTEGGALSFLFGNGARIFTLINIVVLAISVFVSFDRFKDAVSSISRMKADSDVGVLITTAFVILHMLVSLILGMNEDNGIVLYSSFASFAILCAEVGEYFRLSALSKNVSFMMRSQELLGIGNISNKADAASLGHGISDNGEPNIYYAADTKFPEDILNISKDKASDERFFGLSSIIVIIVGIVFAAVFSIVNKSAFYFSTALVGFICLLMPNLRNVVLTALYSKNNEVALASSAAVLSFDSCDEIGSANAVVINAGDIFEANVSKFRTVPGSRMALSDAVVYTAATINKTGSLLANCFDDFLKENEIAAPEGEDVKYEERLGYSSWVAGRRVLVGNREMLKAHSIPCPSSEEELKYSKGRSVMYVAVEGIIAATFIVTFSTRSEIRKSIKSFNRTGLILMINCLDSWLNEDVISKKLGADKATIKLTNIKGSEIISSYKNNALLRENCGLVCSKKQNNVLAVIDAAHNLYSSEKLALLISIVGIVLSFMLLVLCAAFAHFASFSAIACIIIQAIWAAVSYYISVAKISR